MAKNTNNPSTAPKLDKQAVEPVGSKRQSTTLPSKSESSDKTNFQRFVSWLRTPLAGRIFMFASLLILLCTVMFWTIMSAGLHRLNADQLIDSYLFENTKTFADAIFPGAHTFLIKWPIFAVMQLFGSGINMFQVATVLIVCTTVGGLIYLLHRIEKRPYVFGIFCLALASILLLVPAQPYAGALLPVNMAMTTTRNLEYLVFLLVLWFAARLPKIESWSTIGIALVLTALIASDKLFAVLAAGSCLFALFWYSVIMRQRTDALRALGWLAVVITALGAATVLLLGLDQLGVTGVNNGESASPFALISSFKQAAIAAVFAVGALFTNFGANPVHDVTVLRDIPSALVNRLLQPSIVAYAGNVALLIIGMYATVRLLISRRRMVMEDNEGNVQWLHLSILLVGATLMAVAVYILTDHYHPVDARYLTIAVFAVSIAAAEYFRNRRIRMRTIAVFALLLMTIIPIGLVHSLGEYRASEVALSPRNNFNARVSVELDRRNIKRLVGDYWDVTPVKATMTKPVTIAPVDNCDVPRPALNSEAWFKQPKNTPTAFLAVRDGSPEAGPNASMYHQSNRATYGGCSIQKLVGSYGVPSERVRIEESTNKNGLPDVMLLMYPNGTKTEAEAAAERKAAQPKTPVRKELKAISDTTNCSVGMSLQVVAHEDDDILFMNPDVLDGIKAGKCMRTVYVTAGNAGEGVNYWSGREQGAKAAYAEMFSLPNEWRDEQQYIGERKVVVSHLKDQPKVSLVFLRLPDGNIGGQGFLGNKFASLHGLLNDSQASISAVDESATYTKAELIQTIQKVMEVDQTDEIRTLGSDDQLDGDHADHHDVGILTEQAASGYTSAHTVAHYLGYPGHNRPMNLPDEVVAQKQTIFLAYAKFDGAVCQTVFECTERTAYGGYLARQYQP